MFVPFCVAYSFQFRPLSVTLEPTGRAISTNYTVINDSSNRIAFQITILTRQIDIDGKETNAVVTNLFTVFPMQGILQPGQRQTVRVIWRGPVNLTNELAFRILAEEIPVETSQPQGPQDQPIRTTIRMVTRYLCNIYVRPKGAKYNLEFSPLKRLEDGTYYFVITNTGTARAYITNPKLTLIDRSGKSFSLDAQFLKPLEEVLILSAHARRIILKLPEEFTEPEYNVELRFGE